MTGDRGLFFIGQLGNRRVVLHQLRELAVDVAVDERIARALAVDPRILILDDATASVDATTESLIRAGLTAAMRDRTTIVIAHRLSTISLADTIVVLEHGRIVAKGSQTELLETSPVFREIHEFGLLQEIGVSA